MAKPRGARYSPRHGEHVSDPAAAFGGILRQWRERRRMSQLDLAVETGVSSRHLSFIETGRAQPSREMLLLLAGVLDVPLRTIDLDASMAPFLSIEFRKGDCSLKYFTTLTSLGTPHDVTLQGLRVECFYPADEETERTMSHRLAKSDGAS